MRSDRFWSALDKSGSCWVWTRGRASTGYGKCYFHGANEYAHRVAYRLTNGLIPAGMHVLHSCDNPPCCNPAHLRIGTHRENMADMFSRGRANRPTGERQYKARLTAAIVVELRRRARSGESQCAMARALGVSEPTVNNAVTGVTWRTVDEPTWLASASQPTRCKHGHEYTPENTSRSSNGRRLCLKCQASRRPLINKRCRDRRLSSAVNERDARAKVLRWLRANGPTCAASVASGVGRPKPIVSALLYYATRKGEAVRIAPGVFAPVQAVTR